MQIRLAIVCLALVAATAPLPATIVERVYSRLLYPAWQAFATSASNLVPVAVLDIFIALVVGAFLIASSLDIARRRSRGWPRTLGRMAARTLVWAATLYLLFLASWGFNYRRVRLTE